MRTALPFGTHLPGLEVIAAAPQGAAAFGGQEACGPLASQTKGAGAVAPGPLGALRAPAAPPRLRWGTREATSRQKGSGRGAYLAASMGLPFAYKNRKEARIPMQSRSHAIVSIGFYLLSLALFLAARLSVVGGTVMSGTALGYHYPLRLAVHCLAILSAIAAALWGKPKKRAAVGKLALSAAIILFLLVVGVPNNVMA